MKKAFSLILALVMCLSLCACGGGEKNDTTEGQSNTTEGQSNTPAVEVPRELAEQISGDWTLAYPDEGAINIYEGVLLTLGDEKYEMKYEGYGTFTVWCEDMNLGYIYVLAESDGDIYLDVEICEYDTQPSFKGACYKVGYDYVGEDDTSTEESSPQYATVEITMDNWQDYFEFKKDYLYYEDAFGGCERIEIYYILVCKDGIQIEESLSNVAVECSYTREYCYLEINPEDKTYTWSEKRTLPTDETETAEMWNVRLGGYDNVKQYGYGANVCMFLSQGGESQYGWICSNLDVIQVKGSIALIGAE